VTTSSVSAEPAVVFLATLAAEQEAGLLPGHASRPLFPWEHGTINLAGIDDDQNRAYAATAKSVDEVRDAVLDALTLQVASTGSPRDLARSLDRFAARMPPAVRQTIEAATTDVLGVLRDTHQRGGQTVVGEARSQGAKVGTVKTDAPRGAYRAEASAPTNWVYQRISQVVSTGGVQAPTDPAAAVQQAAAVKMDGGYDLGRQGVNIASGNGRRRGAEQLPEPAHIYASEILDNRTCQPCRRIDGREYPTVAAAHDDYPDGGYDPCEGGHRCRGTLVYVWEEDAPGDGSVPAPQQGPEPVPWWRPGERPFGPTPPEPAPKRGPVETSFVKTETGYVSTFDHGMTVTSTPARLVRERKPLQQEILRQWDNSEEAQLLANMVENWSLRTAHPNVALARDESGRVVGVINYDKVKGAYGKKELHIHDVRVHREARGLQTGQAMIQHVRQVGAAEGREVTVYNALDTAIPFYERTGGIRRGDSHMLTWPELPDPSTVPGAAEIVETATTAGRHAVTANVNAARAEEAAARAAKSAEEARAAVAAAEEEAAARARAAESARALATATARRAEAESARAARVAGRQASDDELRRAVAAQVDRTASAANRIDWGGTAGFDRNLTTKYPLPDPPGGWTAASLRANYDLDDPVTLRRIPDHAIDNIVRDAMETDDWDLVDILDPEVTERQYWSWRAATKSSRLREYTEEEQDKISQLISDAGWDPYEAAEFVTGVDKDVVRRAELMAEWGGGKDGQKFRDVARTEWAQEQYSRAVEAENDTKGYMLNKAGQAYNARARRENRPLLDPYHLFRGTEKQARLYASDELREWWDQNGGRIGLDDWIEDVMWGRMSGRHFKDTSGDYLT